MEIRIIKKLNQILALLKDKKPEDEWMSLIEVCDYTKLSSSTIHRYLQKGMIKASKTTGKYLFKRSWVDTFLGL